MAYGTRDAIRVEGLDELVKKFTYADKGLGREIRGAIRDAGEIVRVDAQERAVETIRNINYVGPNGQDWSRMRLGITGSAVVYIVPKSRRRGGSPRRRLGGLLVHRAMEPAAVANRSRVVKEIEDAIENLHQNAHLIGALHNI